MLDKVITTACLIFVAVIAWAATGPGGMGLPIAAQIVMTLSLCVLLLGHMWKHLGGPLMTAFFATGAALEWAFEQSNITLGGFIWGDIRYGDLGVFSVHLGDVPVVVPVLMAAMLWPTYAMVNLALDGRIVADPRSMVWWQIVWRCALYGMVHSWLMLVFNADCEKFGVYRWVGRSLKRPAADMFLGDPTAPRGWAIYVLVTTAVFTAVMLPLIGKAAVARAADPVLQWSDGAPVVLFGAMGVMVYLNPANKTVGNIALWTMGFLAAFVGYRFVALIRAQIPAAASVRGPETASTPDRDSVG
ncbi:hypothetical protein [Mycobacterium sp. E2479]|uniref:hypothetical protein n=1 Tax=Mycobacterium sp. E2479 TaxID=1834134 RepID=UPI0007FE80D1|nr:hypothetical protein [Mycobacterium sp. E2479]OBH49272.1 hypothetical protein A5686_15440 [Mycobacterium sp. E2479]